MGAIVALSQTLCLLNMRDTSINQIMGGVHNEEIGTIFNFGGVHFWNVFIGYNYGAGHYNATQIRRHS